MLLVATGSAFDKIIQSFFFQAEIRSPPFYLNTWLFWFAVCGLPHRAQPLVEAAAAAAAALLPKIQTHAAIFYIGKHFTISYFTVVYLLSVTA